MKVDLSRYDTNSINIQRPQSGYVPNGMDNLFPNYLDGLYTNSPTHQCIVDDLSGYIIGQGLISANPNDEAVIKKYFNKTFLTRLERLRKIHNAITLEVVRNALKRIVEINIINPSQIRVSAVKNGVPVSFRYKKSWDNRVNSSYNSGQEIPCYDQFSDRSILYWYNSGIFDLPYGRPSYLSATDPIEFEISLYMGDNHGAQNGMTPSALITMPDSGDEDKNNDSVRAIQSNLTAVANKGKTATIFTKAGETTAPTVTLLNDNSKESKKINYEVAESGILKGWRIPSPTLISGLNIKPTGFGDAEAEMQWALDELKSKVVEPDRIELLDILKPLLNELEVGFVEFTDSLDEDEEDSKKAASRFAEFGVGGVNGIIEIQRAISEGTSSFEGGVSTLMFVYGFDEEAAKSILGGNKIDSNVVNPREEAPINSNIKDLTGRQFQGIERIVRKFKKGQIEKDQAAMMLRAGFGLNEQEVDTWLKQDLTELSKILTLDEIIEGGQTLDDFEGWEIESIEDATDGEGEAKHLKEIGQINLAKTGTARPNSSSDQDGDKGNIEYKIRYRYSGDQTGQREFCNKMLNANKLYRYEDIVNMSFSNVNAGFGPRGANNYDIFSWKGGKNCKHRWERITFVNRKGDKIDTKSPRAKTLTESQADERRMTPTGTAKTKKRISETRPFDMPNRGAYTLSKLTEIINKL